MGNFGWVIEEAYEKAYLPFIEVLKRHPLIKVSLHLSGGLFEWIRKNKVEYFDCLRELVSKGQVELLGGGFYEPILPLIPEKDRLAQLALLKDFIKRHFKFEIKGAWLAERVWEPHLVDTFHKAGIKYTIVDDTHFRLTGKDSGEIFGYYITEEDTKGLFIFPTSQKLRYMIPFKLPQDTIEYLKSLRSSENRAVVIADDGEKFGLWPQTYKWVYQEHYLEIFFSILEENSSWLNITTFSEFIERFKPIGRVYLPCASYTEMLGWSQGYFKNFLVKYPEANSLHKKMLYVSKRLDSLEETRDGKRINPAPRAKARRFTGGGVNKALYSAKELLYMGQCNDVYWHGVFGGLYLNHLREAAFRNLIEAEKIIDELSKDKKGSLGVEVFDFDKDGCEEIVVNTPLLNVYISPNLGGGIFEIDYKPKALNLINTLTRRYEAYHAKLGASSEKNNPSREQNPNELLSIHDIVGSKEENLGTHLYYDKYRKVSLIDHFFGDDASFEEFSRSSFLERGDFVEEPFTFKIKSKRKSCTITLTREGIIDAASGEIPVKLEKNIYIDTHKCEMDFKYEIRNMSEESLGINFGVEFNLALKEPQFNAPGKIEGINRIELNDAWRNLNLDFKINPKGAIWYFPIETISGSESGIERTYQGLSLLFIWRLELKPLKSTSLGIRKTIN